VKRPKFDFDAALRRIADKMENGHLLLAMGPEAFLTAIEERLGEPAAPVQGVEAQAPGGGDNG
jgi:hypothetical protein